MKTDNALLVIAIVAVAVSIIGAGITYNYISSFRNKLTGFATDIGTVNLTVDTIVTLNFTTNNINLGNGVVTGGASNATLDTSKRDANNLTNGNWTGNTAGFVVENIGNKNATVNLSFGVNAASLLGGTYPTYEINVTNNEGTGGCINYSGGTDGLNLGEWWNANTTQSVICPILLFDDDKDVIRIDIKLGIPSDSKTGSLGDIVTATFAQAAAWS